MHAYAYKNQKRLVWLRRFVGIRFDRFIRSFRWLFDWLLSLVWLAVLAFIAWIIFVKFVRAVIVAVVVVVAVDDLTPNLAKLLCS